ncbi:MAG: HAD-IC family P-type ATPase [Anaerolineaceae bacterium]|nr:HAD-IC family P-type ATPase [Anaerolineaceae bacterium]
MTSLNGLTSAEVSVRQKQYGPNAIPEPKHRLLKLILRQFAGIFNLLLIAAAIITIILGEPTDAAFIFFFVILGTFLNVYQEFKANDAADKLKTFLVKTITVVRDGQSLNIPTEELVPGDVIKLESGDIVPADAVIMQSLNLMVDETTFTGESIPVTKTASATPENESDPQHLLLQGVNLISGNALAEVTATGTQTRLAKIAKKASEVQAESDLTQGVDRISKFILRLTLIVLVALVIANILINGKSVDIPQLLIFAIALAVSVIPEALPLVLTFSLSRGAMDMSKKKVIVKRLSSVQDLGSVDLLCTDKTGTITENKLYYQDSYRDANSAFDPMVLARLAAINLNKMVPEPFDKAVDAAVNEAQRTMVESFTLEQEEAFDPALRSNGAFVRSTEGSQIHIRRGSPEYFFQLGLVKKEAVQAWMDAEENLGHRILGTSYDDGSSPKFAGFVSFEDRLKESTKATVQAAKELNVKITIITGDSLVVAKAVGREAGLVSHDDEVIEAGEFLKLPVEEMHERLGLIRVFARTTPEQKLDLINLLKEKFTVGYLGEGINDAPALKAANVSMVVESASDVARETADIVLLESDLRVIVDGIRIGRTTHANTLKYIRATLISNFGNFFSVAIGSLLISFLPMLPKQLLLLNLLSDFPMMAIAFDKVSDDEIAHPQKYDFKSMYITFVTLGLVSTVFDFLYFALFYRISPAVLQTNWYIGSVLTELLLIFSIRSFKPIWKAGAPSKIIQLLSYGAMILTVAIPLIPITRNFFQFILPTWSQLLTIITIALSYLAVTEIVKRPLAKFLKLDA